jgi:hypothetical protein
MASIIVCDQCGEQVPNKAGSAGPKGWLILRAADFSTPEKQFCTIDCVAHFVNAQIMDRIHDQVGAIADIDFNRK